MIRSTLVALSIAAFATLVGCTADTTEPEPSDNQTSKEATPPTVDTSKIETTAFCMGPKPICQWPDLAVCTCGTLQNPCRWRCP